ncbi:MAG: SBBP repeat-containing protein, partial [Chitinophagaceae bacterium]|nr:SBBP repeat-containing protein [Chitinophagaceae bacterium]
MDGSGNVLLTGLIYGTADFDPGAGTSNLTSAGNNDIFLAKYNSSGAYVWAFRMGGTGSDVGNSLAVDGSGNVLLTGNVNGALAIDFDPGSGTANRTGAGLNDIFLAKYNSSGAYVWAFRLGGAGNDVGNSLALDGSGNVLLTGYINGTTAIDFDPGAGTANRTGAGNNDIFLAKYDASGAYVWANCMGAADNDAGASVALDGSGNVLVTGNFKFTVDFDPGAGTANLSSGFNSLNVFIAGYTSSGGAYVSAGFIFSTSFSDPYVGAAIRDGNGNMYITGYYWGTVDFDPGAGIAYLTQSGSGTTNNYDLFIAKYDASGNYVWAKSLGSTQMDGGYSLALDGSGNVIVTGVFSRTVDFDPGEGTSNLTAAGTSNEDIFVAKYDASGNYVWAIGMGGTNGDVGRSVAVDGSGNVLVTGYFQGTVDFDPGPGTSNLTSAGSSDIYLAKYDASGNYVWAKRMGSTSQDYVQSIAVDGSGNMLLTGSFQGTVDFDPGAGTSNLTSAGSSDIYLAKYDASGNYVWANGMGG